VSDDNILTVRKWKLILKAQTDKGLSKSDSACLAYLLERYNQEFGCAWPSFNRMAKDLEISRRQARLSVDKLKKYGYVHVISGTRTTSNTYKPNFDCVQDWSPGWCDKGVGNKYSLGGEQIFPRVGNKYSLGVGNKYSPQPFLEEPITIKHTHSDQSGGDSRMNNSTKESVCVKSFSNEEEKKPLKKDNGELTAEQLSFINEMVNQPGVRKPGAYKAKLIAQAKCGELVMPEEWISSSNKGNGSMSMEEVKSKVQAVFEALTNPKADSEPYSLQSLVDEYLVKQEAVEPCSVKQTEQAIKELYPEQAKVTNQKVLYVSKMRNGLNHDGKVGAYNKLYEIDPSLADSIKEEIGLVTVVC